MPLELLPTLILTMLVVGYTPGPANIYSLSCSLSTGRRTAMKAWLGLLTGFSTSALITMICVHYAEFVVHKGIYIVKFIGAAYMLYLAWKTWRSRISEASTNVSCSFRDGFLVQLTNAKMILFELTVYSSFVLPYSDRLTDLLPVCALMLVAGPLANLVWLLLGSVIRPFIIEHQRTIGAVLALALVGCTVMVLIN